MVAFAISALFIKEKCAHIDDDPPKLNFTVFFCAKLYGYRFVKQR